MSYEARQALAMALKAINEYVKHREAGDLSAAKLAELEAASIEALSHVAEEKKK